MKLGHYVGIIAAILVAFWIANKTFVKKYVSA